MSTSFRTVANGLRRSGTKSVEEGTCRSAPIVGTVSPVAEESGLWLASSRSIHWRSVIRQLPNG
ncbi:MAG: hypothetical protein KDA55_12390, partial [Planctomycetales bacterium]|nr:hypothetical protein [Planctomycetales bacterium]